MGFLTNLLTLPVLGPIKGVMWVARQVAEQVERELYDEDTVRGQIQELELRYDLEEISEEEYLAAEERLLARLRALRERRAEEG